MEVSGHPVGLAAFKAVGRGKPTMAGSTPVRLRAARPDSRDVASAQRATAGGSDWPAAELRLVGSSAHFGKRPPRRGCALAPCSYERVGK